jgi:hypothetical protein
MEFDMWCNFDFKSGGLHVRFYIENNTELSLDIRDLVKRWLQMWHFRLSITLSRAKDVYEGRATSWG